MKLPSLMLALFFPALSAFGSPCVSATLQDYAALGSTGCTVASPFQNILFSDFTPQTPSGSEIPASKILVAPATGLPGLVFTLEQAANSNELFEAFFRFSISGSGLIGLQALLGSSSAALDGVVTGTLEGCGGASFAGPGGSCGGALITLITVAGDGFSVPSDSIDLASLTSIDVFANITFDGGTLGSASGGSFTVQVVDAPEPSTAILTLSMLAGLAALKRRIRQKHSTPQS